MFINAHKGLSPDGTIQLLKALLDWKSFLLFKHCAEFSLGVSGH